MELPSNIKVRIKKEGTGSVHLGYITYVDATKKLRKEKSWSAWGTDYFGEFSNIPKSGYKLEEVVKRSSEWFGSGRTMFRLQHPDNFIFEITSDNFAAIARSSNIVKGEIMSECILAWEGAALSLIPADSELYQEQLNLKSVVDAGPVKGFEIGKTYKNKSGYIVGYYGGSYVVANIKSNRGNYVGSKWRYDLTITFSMLNMFYSYTNAPGPNFFRDSSGNWVDDGNPTHIVYNYNSWVDPKLFACSSEESDEFEKTHIFDRNAVNNIDDFNKNYISYREEKLIPSTADMKYFEKLCNENYGNLSYSLDIKYNKISDKYLINKGT